MNEPRLGWKSKAFADVVLLQRGFDLPSAERQIGCVPVLGSNGQVGTHDVHPGGVPVPTLTVGRSGSVGKVCFSEEGAWPLNTTLFARDFCGNDPKYVYFWLQYFDLARYAQGVSVPTLNRNSFGKIQVLVPPLNEQQGIASALDRCCEAVTIERTIEEAATELKRATLTRLFTRGLRGEAQKETDFGAVPQSWREQTLAEVATVQTGAAKGRKLDPSATIEVPYLRVANVQDGHLDLREVKKIQIHRDELSRYSLRNGDVVLTEGGDFDKLGRGYIWRGELDQCVHQNHVFAVRSNRSSLRPEFFAYLAQSQYGKAYFLKVAHKTTNLACINTTKLKAFPVVYPTLVEQDEIVSVLTAIDHKITLHQQKRAVLEELFKALLHKLMTGEIVVNDLDLTALAAADEGSPA